MAGIFRYNNSANRTPRARNTLSPFCTSPGQLQDITMDNSYVFGNRSPTGPSSGGAGNTSPRHQGRSLREHQEELSQLRKENFNLKLRIYFLEEKTPSAALSAGSETLYKQNVDLKVTTEAMRAELKEKQSLLCEAAAALELMEQSQTKCQDDALAATEQLNQKIQFLEMEIKAMEKFADNDNTQMLNRRLTELERLVLEYEQQTTYLSEQIRNAEDSIAQKDGMIRDSEQKYGQMAYELAELKEQLVEKNEAGKELELTSLRNQIYENKKEMAEKECLLQELTDSLSECQQAKDNGCKTIQFMMFRIKSLEIELNRLKGEQTNSTEGVLEEAAKQSYLNQIRALQTDLQIAHDEAADAHKWRKECADVCGMLTSRLTELAEFLDSLLKQKDVLGDLGQDRRKAMRKAVDKSLDLSRSLNNMSLTSDRLSLNETSFMQQFSSLSDMLNVSAGENKENQHNNSAMEIKECGNSSNNQAALIETLRTEVQFLKNELEKTGNTGSSVLAKKERKSFPSSVATLAVDPNSESEAWSEPDRKVSHARIGLDDVSVRGVNISRSPKKYSINDTASNTSTASELEGSGAGKLSRKNSSLKYQERIAEVELKLAERDSEILKQQCRLVESDNRLKTERLKLIGISKELKDYQDLNSMLELEISAFKEKMAESQALVDLMKENEAELSAQIIDSEKTVRALKKQLDEAALQNSMVVLERTKVISEKLNIEKHNSDLQQQLDVIITERAELKGRIAQLAKSNATLQNRLVSNDTTQYQLARSASHGNARYTIQQRTAEHSSGGYTSDEVKQRLENSSPDLGIESDAGQTSASDAGRRRAEGRAASQNDLATAMNDVFIEDEEEPQIVAVNHSSPSRIGTAKTAHNCAHVDEQNIELKKKLVGAHSAYKNILTQLRASNSRKEQFERDIRREICKTQNVLKNVRTNIESVEPHPTNIDAKLSPRKSS